MEPKTLKFGEIKLRKNVKMCDQYIKYAALIDALNIAYNIWWKNTKIDIEYSFSTKNYNQNI